MIIVTSLLIQKINLISSMLFFVNIGPKLASNIHSSGQNYFDYPKDPKNASMYMKPTVKMSIMIKIIEKSK